MQDTADTTMLSCNSLPEDEDTSKMWIVHIEVRLSTKASARHDTIRSLVQDYITSSCDRIYLPSTLQGWEEVPLLASAVERVVACECTCPSSSLTLEQISLHIHVYQPQNGDSFEEFVTDSINSEGDEVMSATVCELPSKAWDGLWDSLIYSDGIKTKLLEYIHATLLLSDAGVDFNMVCWNRIILLHGPPGTGKTSLCRALAQKLSIRLSHRYPRSRLLEINSHSLFSRWFSESGKLVQKLFNDITELVEEEDSFVVVLIDEIESLTAARAGALAGTEPSDGLRVVNALLTQMDKLKHRKNVLIMSTSNLVKAIDSAFVDRADIVQYVDLPPREAIYDILRGSLCEMISKGLVLEEKVPTLSEALVIERIEGLSICQENNKQPLSTTDHSHLSAEKRQRFIAKKLLSLALDCRKQGMSGRSLRRLPVLALARYGATGTQRPIKDGRAQDREPQTDTAASVQQSKYMRMMAAHVEVWLDAMSNVVEEKAVEHGRLL